MSTCSDLDLDLKTDLDFRERETTLRQPMGKSMVSSVNSHTNATRIGWHLWEIDLRFAPRLPKKPHASPGIVTGHVLGGAVSVVT